jgi:mannose-1-phosphate guanylyltransferase
MNETKGIILCGGQGKRFRPITYYFQKAMIPVGKRQKPVLEYIVRFLRHHGIDDLKFLVDYKSEQIMNYFDDGSRFDVTINYVKDKSELKGTAGSLLNAYRDRAIKNGETMLVYYGDILTLMNLRDFISYHKKNRAIATVALASEFPIRVGLAEMEHDGKITKFVEKPKLNKPVSIAMVVLEGKALDCIEELYQPKHVKQGLDLMGDVIPYFIDTNNKVYGYVTNAYWYDVGSIEAYEKLSPEIVEDNFSFLF